VSISRSWLTPTSESFIVGARCVGAPHRATGSTHNPWSAGSSPSRPIAEAREHMFAPPEAALGFTDGYFCCARNSGDRA
jgi:hypothetical protein